MPDKKRGFKEHFPEIQGNESQWDGTREAALKALAAVDPLARLRASPLIFGTECSHCEKPPNLPSESIVKVRINSCLNWLGETSGAESGRSEALVCGSAHSTMSNLCRSLSL